jgi:hypothetical protein
MAITINNRPPVVCLSDQPAILAITTSLTGVENLHVIVEPKYFNRGTPIGSDFLYPPPAGSAETDLSEYLREVFQQATAWTDRFTLPDNAFTGRLVENHAMRYSIKIKEGSGFPASYTETDITNRYVVPGRIPDWYRNKFYSTWYSFWSWILAVKPFLTLAPLSLKTTRSQIRHLYWLCWYAPDEGHTLSLKVNLRFTDNTNADWIKSELIAEPEHYGVYEFPAGYNSLGITAKLKADYPDKEVESWAVTVMDGSTAVSETREFVLDNLSHEAERELVFANSVGGYDTIMLTGEGELSREHEPEPVNVLNAGFELPTKRNFRSTVKEIVKANTGWLTTELRSYISELLISREVYEISGNELLPVNILKQSIVAAKDNDTLQALQIEYEPVTNYYYENGL